MRLSSTYSGLGSVCCAKFNVGGGSEGEVDRTSSCAWFGTVLGSRMGMFDNEECDLLGMSGDRWPVPTVIELVVTNVRDVVKPS